jgi:hypothetical protein
MSRILAIAIGLALPLPAHAQQQSPMEQALPAKLGAEIGGSLQCSAAPRSSSISRHSLRLRRA